MRNFLSANALYWLQEFHIDGLRVDAVASMLYLDYSREPGEWIPNRHGGRENLGAIALLQEVNTLVGAEVPGALMIAEESTAWPKVTYPVHDGGLGFTHKWNMGWMHDTLGYLQRDSLYRQFHHRDLTFGLLYTFGERYVLPLSHDEVVHGKSSLLGKMPGDDWQRFANLRAAVCVDVGPARRTVALHGRRDRAVDGVERIQQLAVASLRSRVAPWDPRVDRGVELGRGCAPGGVGRRYVAR